MTKVKESVERVEDLKAQVGEILGATDCLDDDIIKSMEETFIKGAKEIGEGKAEEALALAKKAMSLVENDEFKGILVSCMLSRLPILMQNVILNGQKKVITSALMARLHEVTKGNPLKGLMLMAAALQSMEKKEENEWNQNQCKCHTPRWCDAYPR